MKMEVEYEGWEQQLSRLRKDVAEFNHYDSGYSYIQKQKFSEQRIRLISNIKHDILDYPPFAEIAYKICCSRFCFDECYDCMDSDMEHTIREILNMQIEK